MNYRINTKVVIFVAILVCIALGLFVYTLVSTPIEIPMSSEDEIVSTEQPEVQIMTAKHQFLDGMHTIAGKSEVPTPCHRLVAEPFFVTGSPVEVEIRFNTLLEGEECPSQLFEVPFRVSFEAPEDAVLSATWNGGSVRLNLIPLQDGEVLDDEIYIKG